MLSGTDAAGLGGGLGLPCIANGRHGGLKAGGRLTERL